MSLIYHITTRSAEKSARQSGEYRVESLLKEGFIHFSQRHQLSGVANSFYKGQTDLVILVVDETLLIPEIKYEAPVHPGGKSPEANSTISNINQLFPHVYGPLNFNAVVDVLDLPMAADGSFEIL